MSIPESRELRLERIRRTIGPELAAATIDAPAGHPKRDSLASMLHACADRLDEQGEAEAAAATHAKADRIQITHALVIWTSNSHVVAGRVDAELGDSCHLRSRRTH